MGTRIRTESKQVVHQGHILTIERRRLVGKNERAFDVDVVLHAGAAAVVPIDQEGYVYLVRQERWAVDQMMLEIPAGRRDAGESLLQCAKRELEEEVGQRCESLIDLGAIHTTPGFCNECIGLYMACDLEPGRQHLDDNEDLEVVRMPLHEAVAMARDGRLSDGKTVVGLLRAAHRRQL